MTLPVALLVDLHISPKTVEVLRGAGYAISRVSDHLPATSSDEQIVELATRLHSAIVTQDLDFSALIARSGSASPSVLSLRIGNVAHQHVTNLLLDVLPMIQKELEQGAIISVDDFGIRIRPLPVG